MTEMHARRFTRRQMASVAAFALAFVLLFLTAEELLYSDAFFSPTWTRIREKRDVPQVLIMGNSHAFCSFAPGIINGALGLDAAVLGASGQNSAATVDSLEAVLSVGKPEIVVAELNAFVTDYELMAHNNKSSMLSNINGMPGLWQRARSAWHEFGFENIPQGMFQLLRSDLMWERWDGTPEIDFAPDGSSHLNWHASGQYDAQTAQQEARQFAAAETPSSVGDENEAEFRRMMEMAQRSGVQVLLVKTPAIASAQESRNKLRFLSDIAHEYGDTLLGFHDFHLNLNEMGLTVQDYYDNGHLSRSGAVKFSRAFTEWLGGLLGKEADFDRCFAYAGEAIETVGEDCWRYTMSAFGRDVHYRFTHGEGEDAVLLQDWSTNNTLETNIPPERADEIFVSMCPAQLMDAADKEAIHLSFMTANTYVLR